MRRTGFPLNCAGKQAWKFFGQQNSTQVSGVNDSFPPEQIADGVVGGKALDAGQGVQGAITAYQTGVSKSFGPGQHRDQKRRQGYGGLDLVRRSESEGYMLAHLAGEAQLFKKSHKHSHAA